MAVAGFMAFSISGTAQTTSTQEKKDQVQTKQVDQSTPIRNFVDKDGDGKCDNYATRGANGRNFVDANKDGVCDNRGQGNQNGQGYCGKHQSGKGNGKGCCNGKGNRHRNGSGGQSAPAAVTVPQK